ncbi:MAG: hypothetical protein H6711_15830 [Myxococcales bacterium]|nr:hypothetical protein [Myxococcales bacterium]
MSRAHCLASLLICLLVGACGAQGATAAPSDDALREASRISVERSEPDAAGWRLLYRNRGDVELGCRANLRWVEEHPPHGFLAEVEERFRVPAGGSVNVVFRRSDGAPGIDGVDAEARGGAQPDMLGARRPAARAEYAQIEAERDGLYLRCDPPPPAP